MATGHQTYITSLDNTTSNTNGPFFVIGQNNTDERKNSFVAGTDNTLKAYGATSGIIVGKNNKVDGADPFPMLVGYDNTSLSPTPNCFAIGSKNLIASVSGICVGNSNTATNTYPIALGINSISTGIFSVAIGHYANASGQWSLCIASADSNNSSSIAAPQSICIGVSSSTHGYQSLSIGFDSIALGAENISIGNRTKTIGNDNICISSASYDLIGHSSLALNGKCNGSSAISIRGAAYHDHAIAIGSTAQAYGQGSVALGRHAISLHRQQIAIGGVYSPSVVTKKLTKHFTGINIDVVNQSKDYLNKTNSNQTQLRTSTVKFEARLPNTVKNVTIISGLPSGSTTDDYTIQNGVIKYQKQIEDKAGQDYHLIVEFDVDVDINYSADPLNYGSHSVVLGNGRQVSGGTWNGSNGLTVEYNGDVLVNRNLYIASGNECNPETGLAVAAAQVSSDEYSALKTYDVGDYCIYSNTFYKCKTAIIIPKLWDANDWEATSIAKELKALWAAI